MHVDKAQEERRADESRQRVMLTIIRRMMHGAMAWGFGVWSSKVLQASHERETMGRVLMRMSNRALSAGTDDLPNTTSLFKTAPLSL